MYSERVTRQKIVRYENMRDRMRRKWKELQLIFTGAFAHPVSTWSISGAVLLVTLLGCGSSTSMRPDPDYSILFIGNSLTYTNDLPAILEDLLEYSDLGEVEVEAVARANYGLIDHWFSAGARDKINEGRWDVIIMQQGPSATEGRPSLLEYSQKFSEEIRSAGATPAMYMVWPAYERLSDFFGVSDSYSTAANQIDGFLFPVGEAWLRVWSRRLSYALYGRDGFHPSFDATYLAALVMYQQLAGRDPRTLPESSVPRGMSTEDALLLQTAAAEANEAHARIPNSRN